ncbi:Eco57I restriction-modification methylase domain-containing protein [Dysgonomonas mossii]|uniref:Eco57I restriction-modification methylase domain-containing protein n=1 Tax=Dysgonomonas mossii TaxID=163665 RepID=UPI0039947E45
MKQSISLNNFLSQLGLQDTVFFKDKEGKFPMLHLDIQNKLSRILPDALYTFNNLPLILFFDMVDNHILEKENEIHKKAWSFDYAPIIFIVKSNEIKVYNALNYIKSKDKNELEEVKLSQSEIIDKFSFWNLQSGYTWKWLQNEYYESKKKGEYRKRVNERLFQNIKEVRKKLTDKCDNNNLSEHGANTLILRLIFIRYLIDRGIHIDESYISGNTLNEKRISFANLIKNYSRLKDLFTKLNGSFNGVLFKDINIDLTSNQAKYLGDVFKGEIEQQGSLFEDFFFEIFDFSIIPVEVISGIYESLIDEETKKLDAAVYTPSFLVEYILNNTLDLYLEEKNTSECCIFEVAVGSGIFLVQSLRKMIEKEKELNPNIGNEEFSRRIRDIAKNNLFGIDVNKEALIVSCFSIYIALLDYQTPKEVGRYPFPTLLNENLFEADFFDTTHRYNNVILEKRPHFILGNPPWKKDKSEKHLQWVNSTSTYNKKINGKLEIAQSFILRTKSFMTAETKAALIVTSTIFYNISSTAKEFKGEFLSSCDIERFFDLSPVKQCLFEQQESPTSIIFYKLSSNESFKANIIKHQSIKVNYFLKHFRMLVIEKFDNKEIPQQLFIDNDWMFKVALYGSTLDFQFLKRVRSNAIKLIDLIDRKNIYGGAGVLRGNKENQFDFLLGLPMNENKQINDYLTINSKSLFSEKDNQLESGRSIELFDGDKILFKEQAKDWTDVIVSYNEEASIFFKGVFALTTKDSDKLKEIFTILISNLYTYYIFLISGSWGTSTRPQIRWTEEYLSFPIISTEQTKCELIKLAEAFLLPLREYYNQIVQSPNLPIKKDILEDINIITHKLYGISEIEKDLIDYTLKISRYQFQESKQSLITDFTYLDDSHYRNRTNVLKNYANVFINEFGKIYENEYIQVEIYTLGHFIAMNFVFHSEIVKDKIVYVYDKLDEIKVLTRLGNLSVSQITSTTDPSKNIFIQKDIKGFEENSFYIIKPNEYKCWHRAMAWYDVAEFKAKIEEAELKDLNNKSNE